MFLRPLALAVAGAGAAPLAAGCWGPAPAVAPTVTQLLASAAGGLRGGHPCTASGDVDLGPLQGNYDSVSSISAGDRFSATITRRLPTPDPFQIPVRFINDGAALYVQSQVQLQLSYKEQVPAGLTGRWSASLPGNG